MVPACASPTGLDCAVKPVLAGAWSAEGSGLPAESGLHCSQGAGRAWKTGMRSSRGSASGPSIGRATAVDRRAASGPDVARAGGRRGVGRHGNRDDDPALPATGSGWSSAVPGLQAREQLHPAGANLGLAGHALEQLKWPN